MADSSERYYHPRRIGIALAAASLALLASMVWWIKVDYDRPWRRIQDQFTRTQALLAYCDLAVVRARGDPDGLAQATKGYQALSDVTRQRVINFPLFDFLAPKDAPGRHAIRQLVLPDVRRELGFTQTNTTDRCTTCHLAMGEPAFAPARLAQRLEQAIPALNAQLEAEGRPALTRPTVPGRADLGPGRVAAAWWTLTPARQTGFLDELTEQINRFQTARGQRSLSFAPPLAAHPDPQLFLMPDSPHPMRQIGCTVCHEGNGEETDFVLAAHTPPDEAAEGQWKQTHYVRRAGLVPEYTFETARQGWERPMLPSKYTEANCARCHQQVADMALYDYQPTATHIDEGRYLFTSLGCANCHPQQTTADAARVGSDLTRVASKLTRGFMHNWLWMPQDYRPSTWMPASVQQENNDAVSRTAGGDGDAAPRARTEVIAMSEYLLTMSQPHEPLKPPAELWAPLADETSEAARTAAERGRRLFDALGCLACHAALEHRRTEETGRVGETLGQAWITEDLAAQRLPTDQAQLATLPDDQYDAIWDHARQRAGQMPYTQRVEYAVQHFQTERRALLYPDLAPGPVFTRFAPELSSIRTKFDDHEQAVTWLYDWLSDPRHYSSDTKMPRMQLRRRQVPVLDSNTGADTGQQGDTDEALDLAVYLSRLRANDAFSTPSFDADERDGQAFRAMRDALLRDRLASPDTAADIDAVLDDRQGELTSRLLAPFIGSPDRDRARARIAQLDLQQRRWLLLGQQTIGHYGCHGCHRIPGFDQTPPIGPELTNWAEKEFSQLDFGLFHPAARARRGDDPLFVYLYPPDRDALIRRAHGNPQIAISYTRPAFAWHKLRNPRIWDRGRPQRPYDQLRMPNFFLTDAEADALVTFLLSLKPARVTLAVAIDYHDTPTGRVALGRHLARELNCLGCHLMDSNAPLIQQYYWRYEGGRYMLDQADAPPWLRAEGARVRPDFTFGYLHEVPNVRPWIQARMPLFHLTDQQATQLVDYFAGLGQRESQWLADRLTRINEHRPDSTPGRPWHQDVELGATAASLRRYARANRLVPAHTLDPTQVDADAFTAVHQTILEEADFFRMLLEVSCLFDAPASAPSSPPQIADGEVLFHELRCLQCHIFGDPAAPGANANPTAPDLQRAYERLRPAWLGHWLARPRRILPGTRMPNFFGEDLTSPFAGYPAEDRARLAGRLADPHLIDDPPAQVRALMAFLYDASRNRRNVSTPP